MVDVASAAVHGPRTWCEVEVNVECACLPRRHASQVATVCRGLVCLQVDLGAEGVGELYVHAVILLTQVVLVQEVFPQK